MSHQTSSDKFINYEMTAHLMERDGCIYREIDYPKYEPVSVEKWSTFEYANAEPIEFPVLETGADREICAIQLREPDGTVVTTTELDYTATLVPGSEIMLEEGDFVLDVLYLDGLQEERDIVGDMYIHVSDDCQVNVVTVIDKNHDVNDIWGVRDKSGETIGIRKYSLMSPQPSVESIKTVLKNVHLPEVFA